VADSADVKERGRNFGLHRAMDTMGAVLGLGLAALIIYLVQKGGMELSLRSYHWLVLVGIVPSMLAVLVMVTLVKEARRADPAASKLGFRMSGVDGQFKIFLIVMAVFTLGNSSDFFVILRAQNLDASVFEVTLMLVVFMVGLSIDILRGMRLSCGCFDLLGEQVPFLRSEHVTWGTVGRDAVFLALVLPILTFRARREAAIQA
jgi:hypothetical protein